MLRTDPRRALALLLCSASLALASCASVPQMPERLSIDLPAPDLSAPTSMADMQGATILDVDRYRPQQFLPACNFRALPQAEPDAALAQALTEVAQYSSSEQGVGLIVLHDGAVVQQRFANGLDGTTPFASASMMKSVMGLLVGVAIEDGLIGSLDDRVGEYLAEWQDDPRAILPCVNCSPCRAGWAHCLLLNSCWLQTPMSTP